MCLPRIPRIVLCSVTSRSSWQYLLEGCSFPPTTTGDCLFIIRRFLLVLLIFLLQPPLCHCIQSATTQHNWFAITYPHKSFVDTNLELANFLTHSLSRSGAERKSRLVAEPWSVLDSPFRVCTAKIQYRGPTSSFTAADQDASPHDHQAKPGKRPTKHKAEQLG